MGQLAVSVFEGDGECEKKGRKRENRENKGKDRLDFVERSFSLDRLETSSYLLYINV